jgi:F1F0 ATPase subunit 2
MLTYPETVTVARILLALIGGLVVGVAYYGGLWWTVNRVGAAERPGLLFGVSFFVRTVLALAGLFLFTALHWLLIAAYMASFIVARIYLTRRWGLEPRSGTG